jgi:hypothetical protein
MPRCVPPSAAAAAAAAAAAQRAARPTSGARRDFFFAAAAPEQSPPPLPVPAGRARAEYALPPPPSNYTCPPSLCVKTLRADAVGSARCERGAHRRPTHSVRNHIHWRLNQGCWEAFCGTGRGSLPVPVSEAI